MAGKRTLLAFVIECRHQYAANLGMIACNPPYQFMPIHFRHINFGKHCVENLRFAERYCLEGVARHRHFVSGPSEVESEHGPE